MIVYLFAFMIFLLGGVFAFYIFNTQKKMKDYVLSTSCVKPQGVFAVDNGYTSSDIAMLCIDGTQVCTFLNMKTLSDAINMCNSQISICDRFVYNSSLQTMSILTSASSFVTNVSSDIYTRVTTDSSTVTPPVPASASKPTPTPTPAPTPTPTPTS